MHVSIKHFFQLNSIGLDQKVQILNFPVQQQFISKFLVWLNNITFSLHYTRTLNKHAKDDK